MSRMLCGLTVACVTALGLSCDPDLSRTWPEAGPDMGADLGPRDLAVDAPVGPYCGDGEINGSEECDGTNLGASCVGMGFDGGTLKCTSGCKLDTSGCHRCGDGAKNGDEECDNTDLGGQTCKTQGFYTGTLACAADCKSFDTSGCHDCGNGVLNAGEECDGSDLGGKTCATLGLVGTLACTASCTLVVSGCSTAGFAQVVKGSFSMGSPTSEPCREPGSAKETQHQVTLTRAFELSAYETTQGEFLTLMGYNPSYFGPNGAGADCGTSCPVEMVNWHEAAAYCNALSAEKGFAKCYSCSGTGASVTCAEATSYSGVKVYDCPGYRLPTEAEWERAYRAGTTTAFYNGANDATKCTTCSDAKADLIAWYTCNSSSTTHPVGQKAANAWGLYDMAGNVWEWCHDWYVSDLGSSAVADPWGSGSGSYRVIRGGSWDFSANYLRAAYRHYYAPSYRYYFIGFRCARTR